MSTNNKLKPCLRCGGEKGERSYSRHEWYCFACTPFVRRENLTKRKPWYCGECKNPQACLACASNKRQRQIDGVRRGLEKRRITHPQISRPTGADRYWQSMAHAMVNAAVRKGILPDLNRGEYACVDCGAVAFIYEHRDYSRPLEVEPTCKSCNKRRGTAIWPDASRFNFAKLTEAA